MRMQIVEFGVYSSCPGLIISALRAWERYIKQGNVKWTKKDMRMKITIPRDWGWYRAYTFWRGVCYATNKSLSAHIPHSLSILHLPSSLQNISVLSYHPASYQSNHHTVFIIHISSSSPMSPGQDVRIWHPWLRVPLPRGLRCSCGRTRPLGGMWDLPSSISDQA